MGKGNFNVKCVESEHSWFTNGNIYEIRGGKITDDDGEQFPLSDDLRDIEDLRKYASSSVWELVTDPINTTESLSIYRRKNRVVGTITNGEQKFTQSVSMAKADGDYWKAVSMVVEKLKDKFEVESIEAVPSFDWSAFKSGKFAVHCDTEEKAREFLKECDAQGIKWRDGDKATDMTYWRGKETIYNFAYGSFGAGRISGRFQLSAHLPIIDYIPTKPAVKEVHRTAEVGEWIKVSNTKDNRWKNGEIFKVVAVDKYGARINHPEAKGYDGLASIRNLQYNVLENYQPEVKPEELKPFVKAKVGDKIEVVKELSHHTPKVKIGEELTVIAVYCNSVETEDNIFRDKDEEYIILEEAKQPECRHCHSTSNLLPVEGITVCRVCARKVIKSFVEGEDVHTR